MTTEFPKTVALTTIDYCTYSCAFCPCAAERKARRLTKERMSLPLFMKIVDELADHQEAVKRLNLFEFCDPLLDPRMPALVSYARQRLPTAEICLSSVGHHRFDVDLYLRLRDAGLSVFTISIPTLDPAAYAKIMGVDCLGKVLKTIDECLAAEQGPTLLRIGVPVTAFCDPHNFDQYFVRGRGLAVGYWLVENRADLNTAFADHVPSGALLMQLAGRFQWKPCDRPLDMATIAHDGRVVLCCADWQKSVVLGNVADQTLLEIWRGPAAQAIRESIEGSAYDQIALCRMCSENPKNQPLLGAIGRINRLASRVRSTTP